MSMAEASLTRASAPSLVTGSSRRRRPRNHESSSPACSLTSSPSVAPTSSSRSPPQPRTARPSPQLRHGPQGRRSTLTWWWGVTIAVAFLAYSRVQAFSLSAAPAPFGARRTILPRGQIDMIGSIFKWGGNGEDGEEYVEVNIESPSANVRRISSSIVIDRPPSTVWRILTDYDNLANYVPNLVESKVVAKPGTFGKGVRLYQEGAQKIIGFNFKASLTMDMEEVFEKEQDFRGIRKIKFKLVESGAFNDFSGEWRLQCYGRAKQDGTSDFYYTTRLFYMVTVKPKGPVPVAAIEWRIREDVPTNLRAVKIAAEKLPVDYTADELSPLMAMNEKPVTAWQSDETLQAYISPPVEEEAVVVAPRPANSAKKSSGSTSTQASYQRPLISGFFG